MKKEIIYVVLAILLPTMSGKTQPTATLGSETQIYPSTNQQYNIAIAVDKTLSTNILVTTSIGYYYSLDGGTTWNGSESLPSGLSDHISTLFDATGLAYIASEETSHNVYALQNSSDNCVTWSSPYGVAETLTNDFSEGFVGVDDMPTSPYANYVYGVWTDQHTWNRYVKSNRSTDNGGTFDNMNTLGSDFGEGAKVQTGPNGEVYVCWADHYGYPTAAWPCQNISFFSSTDGGVTYTPGTGIPIIGISSSSGADANFGNTLVNDWPSMAVDKSCGPNRGRVYIAYPSNINTSYPPSNNWSSIAVVYSDNGGSSWSSPVLVNVGGASITSTSWEHQSWMPCISVDDLTGLVAVDYYCINEEIDGVSLPHLTDTYVAYSIDGITWQNIKASSTSHVTSPIYTGGFAGDKIGIVSYNGHSYAAWADDRTGTWQVYVRQIDYDVPTLTASPTNLSINAPAIISQNSNYQAGDNIQVSNIAPVQIGSTANVLMVAGQSITLNPGFSTVPGAVFTAEISSTTPCTTINANAFKTNSANWSNDNSVVKKDFDGVKFFAYPNPALDMITIGAMNDKYKDVSFSVTDISGRLISAFNTPSISQEQIRQIIDVSSYPSGIYIVTMNTGNEKHFVKFAKR